MTPAATTPPAVPVAADRPANGPVAAQSGHQARIESRPPTSLVTGAAGFIGSRLCHRLLDAGHTVVGVDGFTDSYPASEKLARAADLARRLGFRLMSGHLTELPLVDMLSEVEIVYHLAGRAGVRASYERERCYERDNVTSTRLLLGAARHARSVRRLVYASSSSVYGDARLPFREDAPTRPRSPYGRTKLDAELACLHADGTDLETIALRYFTVYGPGQRPDMGLRIFAEAALDGRPLHVFGDGSQSRDFTYVDDIVRATRLAGSARSSGLAINVGGGSRVTQSETLELLSALVGRPLNVRYEQFARGDVRHTGADLTRARDVLGFVPWTPLACGLAAEVDWIRTSRNSVRRLAA
jgi:UDP-glucuronate 4-epimerase